MTRKALSLLVCSAWLASGLAWGDDSVGLVAPTEAVDAASIDLPADEPGALIRTAQFDVQELVVQSNRTPSISGSDEDDDDDEFAWVFFIVSITTFATIAHGSTPAQH